VRKIAVVDDDDEVRELIAMLLRGRYQVCVAPDGAAGLELIRKERPDLVVLDLLMPRMHGFEVCRRLRADPELKGIKVLISSSKSYQHDMSTAVSETGADGYIVKPFDIETFQRRVAELIGEKTA
jgi:twitching motility two-component system response regulator PilH